MLLIGQFTQRILPMPGSEQILALSKEFERHGLLASARAERVAKHFGELLVQKVRANASGSPGPEMVTGAYVASIEADVQINGGIATVNVGTNAPQAYRLEFGFVGVDSLGRQYAQPPFPHFGPAADEYGALFEEACASEIYDLNAERI